MTGPEHYATAEQLLRVAKRWDEDADECRRRGDLVAFETSDRRSRSEHDREARESDRKARRCRVDAQVHATLAQAAATALETVNSGLRPDLDDAVEDTFNDWHTAITGKEHRNG
ncbi:hypothetical protein SEA_PHAUCI_41 [Gordonia Phage Phauci]|uniref:Uncharacterized protein n=1 Tax=Gordonia Phage Phauci TaxID=2951392 RepID=A0A9E7SZM0_9CAUD|nr:hypothetical protein SEA_PHAUCI_41 [Gordonia Phage Phauci]